MRRKLTVVLTVAALFAMAPSPVQAVNYYGGWQTVNKFQGIRGYLFQSVTSPVQNGVVASWINICGPNCSTSWVQMGLLQGQFAGGDSLDYPRMFRETLNVCGVYKSKVLAAPSPIGPPFFSLKKIQAVNYDCGVEVVPAYSFEYKKGDFESTATAFYTSYLEDPSGIIIAKTERQGTAPIGVSRYGCAGPSACHNADFGLRINNGSGWNLWTVNSQSSSHNPPFLETFENYWSYRTCGTPC